MAEVLLSCEMLEDEMQLALQRTGAQMPIVWMDAGLHEYPDKLRAALREKIAELEQDYDTILLGFCLCGNAMDGVGATRARLIVPRFDDCIRMLMSRAQGQMPDVDCHCLYFTHSWTTHGKFLSTQYDETIAKYGEKKGKRVYQMMLKNYEGIRLVDTQAFDLLPCRAYIQQTAEKLNLCYGETTGSIRILEKLLRHEWDDEFYILAPGDHFQQMEFLRHPGSTD